MDVEPRGVDDDLGVGAQVAEELPLGLDAVEQPALALQRVRPADALEAADQGLVGGVEEDQVGAPAGLAQRREAGAQLAGERAGPDVDDGGDLQAVVAGVAGPALIAGLRQFEIDHGVAKAHVYDITLYVMAGLLLVGLICNFLVRPVHEKHWMSDDELTRERSLQHEAHAADKAKDAARGTFGLIGILAWLAVGIPFLFGVWNTLSKAVKLFG